MFAVLSWYAGLYALEFSLWLPGAWQFRRWLAPFVLTAVVVSTAAVMIVHPSFLAVLLGILGLYRSINIARIMADRMQPQHLKSATWRTSRWLGLYTVIIFGLWLVFRSYPVGAWQFWIILLSLQLALAVMLLVTTIRHLYSMRPPDVTEWFKDKDLPTLTVAIPARNETSDLERCLMSLVATTYPKIEILVLDDCSDTKRTPEIIRSFAHEGVRFVQGKETAEGWLAKNQAYQQLLEQANGDYVLFCCADVQFKPQSLTRLVSIMLGKNKSMMSIMPRHILPAFWQLDGSLIQPMRYAWEVALPRKLFRRPPVLSTCWIAKKQLLQSAGGFSAVSRSIVPESYFARQAVRHDGYGFRYSDEALGLVSYKDIADQRDTATRTKYPQLHRRPELVLPLSLAEMFGLVMPFLMAAVLAAYGLFSLPFWLCLATSLVLVAWFMTVCTLTYRMPDIRSFLSVGIAVLLDVVLLNYSMMKYEFSVVLWKKRNVCIPVMRAEASLPPMAARN